MRDWRAVAWILMCGGALTLMGACGGGTTVPSKTPAPTASATPTAAATGVRTVLTPLGLNVHGDPNLQAPVLGSAQQGTELTVLGSTQANGGWIHVRGQTTTGWISADSSLSAPGHFVYFASGDQKFSALYPQNWTFSAHGASVIFEPQHGDQAIAVSGPEAETQLPPEGAAGYGETANDSTVVCGVTGALRRYQGTPSGSATVAGIPLRSNLAQIRIQLDANTWLQLSYTYTQPIQLVDFRNFYNSLAFAWPQCEGPAPSPSATP